MEGAQFIASTCLALKPGEDLLVVCDYLYVDFALEFAKSLSSPFIAIPPLHHNGEEPPPQVSQLFQAYDAILALTTLSLGPTDAREKACRKGVRFVSMAGITKESLSTVMRTDYETLRKRASALSHTLGDAASIEVQTGGHTLEMSIKGRQPIPLTGIYEEKGAFGTLPEGEVLISPVEESVHGSFVADVGMVGVGFFKAPLTFNVERGKVVSLEGPHRGTVERILDAHEGSRQVAEVAVGINPVARWNTIFEAKKVEGSCHIALGDNHTIGGVHRCGIHMDGVISSPTISVDGEVLVKDGNLQGD